MNNKIEIELKYKPLPLTYNCDEIKTLSSATRESYTRGFLKKGLEHPIAIIGIPEEIDTKYLDIKFTNEENENIYKYSEATLLEKDYPKYIVYPYKTSFEEDKRLQHVHYIIMSGRTITPKVKPYQRKLTRR